MVRHCIIYLSMLCVASRALDNSTEPRALEPEPSAATEEDPPEGYYAFVESPNATPPRVRPPPYRRAAEGCAGAGAAGGPAGAPHVSAANLCGDLNRGLVPDNPMGHRLHGEPYPFELIRNLTLRFLSRALPVLRADDTLPRVAHVTPTGGHAASPTDTNRITERHRREAADAPRDTSYCDNGGLFCMLYRAINGSPAGAGPERREDPGARPPPPPPPTKYEGPPTPCPARVEYATPVFARNYQGLWRYVVQIPYEGYFTQTIEVTRCMQARCHYLDGGCLSSPRWVSLLVAELHYPAPAAPTASPAAAAAPAPHHFQEYQQFLQKRGGQVAEDTSTTEKPMHCDGHDEMGCFQVRLYYDWFLVPGSCKCWRPDYFARYVRRRHNTSDL